MQKIKYKTKGFDTTNDDILWEQFMCFARMIIPYEKYWDELTEVQKCPIIAFVYEQDVLSEGHIGFIDLNAAYISLDDVIRALKILKVSAAYIENIERIPRDYFSIDEMVDESADEENFCSKMDELDEVFEQYDRTFYALERESTEIKDKILEYIRKNLEDFFEFSD